MAVTYSWKPERRKPADRVGLYWLASKDWSQASSQIGVLSTALAAQNRSHCPAAKA